MDWKGLNLNGVVFELILIYSLQIKCNFNDYLAYQSDIIFKMTAPSFIDSGNERLRTIFLQWAFKFEMLLTTFYKCAVLFQSWNYREWNLIFWFLLMCKLWRITHIFKIKPFGLYSIYEWFGALFNLWVICRSLHIDKNQKIKFHSYIKIQIPKLFRKDSGFPIFTGYL